MDDQVIVLPKKNAKSKKLYGCPKCSYEATRAYNVQRHLAKHFEKPPKELQHICPYAGCSFSTLRWDNLNRHTSRVHRVTKPREEEEKEGTPSAVDQEILETNEEHLDEYENPELLQIDDDPVSMNSDAEAASLIFEEISGETQFEELPRTEAKPVELGKGTNEMKRKPR